MTTKKKKKKVLCPQPVIRHWGPLATVACATFRFWGGGGPDFFGGGPENNILGGLSAAADTADS